MYELIMHEPIMLSYVNLFLGPLHIMNMSVRTVACSHGVVKATSPVQLELWTKPKPTLVVGLVIGRYDTRNLLYYVKTCSCFDHT